MRARPILTPRFCALPVLVMLVACGPSIPAVGAGGEITGEVTGDASGDGDGSTTMSDQPDPGSDGSTGEPPSTFIEPTDVGASYQCDLYAQDCPAGHKCNVWADDGSNAWNATRCVPIAPDPDEVGEPCTVEGDVASGIDTCGLGAMCWEVDPETNEGVCREYCQGDESSPFCPDPETLCGGPRNFPLCLPLCCPIEQDCIVGEACYAVSDSFQCVPDASGDLGAFGDPCEYINACDPGLVCLNQSFVPDCSGQIGCCSIFCVVGSTMCSDLHPAMECEPWYDEGHAPPGFEFTGACMIPE